MTGDPFSYTSRSRLNELLDNGPTRPHLGRVFHNHLKILYANTWNSVLRFILSRGNVNVQRLFCFGLSLSQFYFLLIIVLELDGDSFHDSNLRRAVISPYIVVISRFFNCTSLFDRHFLAIACLAPYNLIIIVSLHRLLQLIHSIYEHGQRFYLSKPLRSPNSPSNWCASHRAVPTVR